ncbi:MAG: hypothetical protein IT562_07415 [Alphaproteobacteria bacterium]|nr:hypothetical protein [Alphaproteobacteria bacterium]
MDRKQTDVRDQDLMSHPRHFLRAMDDAIPRVPASGLRRTPGSGGWHPIASDRLEMELDHLAPPPRKPLGLSVGDRVGALLRRSETSIFLLAVALTALGFLSIPA